MSTNPENGIDSLSPRVRTAGHSRRLEPPGHGFDLVVCKDTKRRFVLVIAPDYDEVRLEFVKRGADFVAAAEQRLPMAGRFRLALIRSPGIAALLNQTSTVLVVLFAALFLKEPLTKIKLVAVGLAFSGAALVLYGGRLWAG